MNMEATRRYTATWAAMEDLIPTGKVKEIGSPSTTHPPTSPTIS